MNVLARSLTATATFATLLALSATAAASPVTLTLSGRVTSVGGPKVSLLDGLIAVGNPVTVSATYDTDALPAWDIPNRGDFFFTSGSAGVVVNVNGHLFSTDFHDQVNGRLYALVGNDMFNSKLDVLTWQGWSSGPTTSPQGALRTGRSRLEVHLQDLTSPLDS